MRVSPMFIWFTLAVLVSGGTLHAREEPFLPDSTSKNSGPQFANLGWRSGSQVSIVAWKRMKQAGVHQKQLLSKVLRHTRQRVANVLFRNEEDMVNAAMQGDSAKVASLIREGVSPDSRRVTGILSWRRVLHAAHEAAANSHKEVLEVLLSHNATVDIRTSAGETPLGSAASNGHLAIVEFLLAQGADVNAIAKGGGSPLYMAIKSGHMQCAATLIRNGAEVPRAMQRLETDLHRQLSRNASAAHVAVIFQHVQDMLKGSASDDAKHEVQARGALRDALHPLKPRWTRLAWRFRTVALSAATSPIWLTSILSQAITSLLSSITRRARSALVRCRGFTRHLFRQPRSFRKRFAAKVRSVVAAGRLSSKDRSWRWTGGKASQKGFSATAHIALSSGTHSTSHGGSDELIGVFLLMSTALITIWGAYGKLRALLRFGGAPENGGGVTGTGSERLSDSQMSLSRGGNYAPFSRRFFDQKLKRGDKVLNEDLPEELRGDYDPISILGAGGFAVVVKVNHLLNGKQVSQRAVKLIPARGKLFEKDSEEFRRVHREAKMLAMINHRNVVRYHSANLAKAQDVFWIITDMIEGKSVHEMIQENKIKCVVFSEKAAIAAGLDVLRGLEEIHKHRIIHRDIKPANIMFTPRADVDRPECGTYKIIDLGIAQAVATDGEASEAKTFMSVATGGGIRFAGTPEYMCPEAFRDREGQVKKLTDSADLWSLGATLFQMLSGQLPFQGPAEHFASIVRENTPAPDLLDVLKTHERSRLTKIPGIVAKALEKDLHKRYQTAREMYDDLFSCQEEAQYSVFISYRVSSDALLAKLVFEMINNARTPRGNTVVAYLDTVRLEGGEDWTVGFSTGLLNSLVFLPILSEGVTRQIAQLKGNADDPVDNMLKEIQIALAMWDRHNGDGIVVDAPELEPQVQGPSRLQKIYPVCVGKRTQPGEASYPGRTNFFQDGSASGGAGNKYVDAVSRPTTDSVVKFLKSKLVDGKTLAYVRGLTVKKSIEALKAKQGFLVGRDTSGEPEEVTPQVREFFKCSASCVCQTRQPQDTTHSGWQDSTWCVCEVKELQKQVKLLATNIYDVVDSAMDKAARREQASMKRAASLWILGAEGTSSSGSVSTSPKTVR